MDFNYKQNIGTDWPAWKNYLKNAMEFADELGVPKDKVNSMAYQIGDWLAESVTPTNPEQQCIKELWTVADQSERQVLTHLMTKLVNQ